MKDQRKTKKQLIEELDALRNQSAELEKEDNFHSERKRADEALHKSEERFRALTESTSDWIWEVDQSGSFYLFQSKSEGFT